MDFFSVVNRFGFKTGRTIGSKYRIVLPNSKELGKLNNGVPLSIIDDDKILYVDNGYLTHKIDRVPEDVDLVVADRTGKIYAYGINGKVFVFGNFEGFLPIIRVLKYIGEVEYATKIAISETLGIKVESVNVVVKEEKASKEEIAKIRRNLKDTVLSNLNVMNFRLSYALETLEHMYKEEVARKFENGFFLGLKIAGMNGWKVKGRELVYEGRIVVKRVIGWINNNKKGLIDLPEDMIGRYYIEGIKIPFYSIRLYDDVPRVKNVEYENAYHPNAGSYGCIGDWENRPLEEVMENIREIFETANLTSAFDNDAYEELYEFFKQNKDKARPIGNVWEVE